MTTASAVQFHERPFVQRWGQMGDAAEQAFLEQHPNAHRTGLDRTALNVRRMDDNQRYAPDYMIEDGYYEVMGYASRGNNVLKLKMDKLEALRAWEAIGPVYLWVRDSSTGNVTCAPIRQWAKQCAQHAERKFFPDNNRPYWELKPEHFPKADTT